MEWKEDKTKHAIVSLALVLMLYMFTANVALSMAYTMMIGVCKELYDEWSYYGFDWKDLVADVIGIIIGGLICLLI